MINIRITIDNKGNLRTLKAEGHSMSAGKGENIVCAAVSAQLRSVTRALGACEGVKAEVTADSPGFLEIRISEYRGRDEWLNGVTDVLLAGLLETGSEYPEECSIELIRNN